MRIIMVSIEYEEEDFVVGSENDDGNGDDKDGDDDDEDENGGRASTC